MREASFKDTKQLLKTSPLLSADKRGIINSLHSASGGGFQSCYVQGQG